MEYIKQMIIGILILTLIPYASGFNLDFESSSSFTCPIADYTSGSGTCLTSIADCKNWWSQYYINNDSDFCSDGNCFGTCKDSTGASWIRSESFVLDGDFATLAGWFYGKRAADGDCCAVSLYLSNGTELAFAGENSVTSNTWKYRAEDISSYSSTYEGEDAYLAVGGTGSCGVGSGVYPCGIDNITILYSNGSIAALGDFEENDTSNYTIDGYVNDFDTDSGIASADLTFCRVSGSTNFCPTCEKTDITRCLDTYYATTNDTGYYNVNISSGVYDIYIDKSGYGLTYAQEAFVASSTTENYTLANWTFRDIVLDVETGDAISGAYVYYEDLENPTNKEGTFTDINGEVRTYINGDNFKTIITKSGYESVYLNVTYSWTCSKYLNNTLQCYNYTTPLFPLDVNTTNVTFKVYDFLNSSGIEGARVIIRPAPFPICEYNDGQLISVVLTTDSDGLASLELYEGYKYHITYVANDYGTSQFGKNYICATFESPSDRIYLDLVPEYANATQYTLNISTNVSGTLASHDFELYYLRPDGVENTANYTTNDDGYLVLNFMSRSQILLRVYDNGKNIATCTSEGIVGNDCYIVLDDNYNVTINIDDYINTEWLIVDSLSNELTGLGTVVTVYSNCNSTYEDCDVVDTFTDNQESLHSTNLKIGALTKVTAYLSGYEQKYDDEFNVSNVNWRYDIVLKQIDNDSVCLLGFEIVADNRNIINNADVPKTSFYIGYLEVGDANATIQGTPILDYGDSATISCTKDQLLNGYYQNDSNVCRYYYFEPDINSKLSFSIESPYYKKISSEIQCDVPIKIVNTNVLLKDTDLNLNRSLSDASNDYEQDFVANYLGLVYNLGVIIIVLGLLFGILRIIEGK